VIESNVHLRGTVELAYKDVLGHNLIRILEHFDSLASIYRERAFPIE
jgi:hypothetical protein